MYVLADPIILGLKTRLNSRWSCHPIPRRTCTNFKMLLGALILFGINHMVANLNEFFLCTALAWIRCLTCSQRDRVIVDIARTISSATWYWSTMDRWLGAVSRSAVRRLGTVRNILKQRDLRGCCHHGKELNHAEDEELPVRNEIQRCLRQHGHDHKQHEWHAWHDQHLHQLYENISSWIWPTTMKYFSIKVIFGYY